MPLNHPLKNLIVLNISLLDIYLYTVKICPKLLQIICNNLVADANFLETFATIISIGLASQFNL